MSTSKVAHGVLSRVRGTSEMARRYSNDLQVGKHGDASATKIVNKDVKGAGLEIKKIGFSNIL